MAVRIGTFSAAVVALAASASTPEAVNLSTTSLVPPTSIKMNIPDAVSPEASPSPENQTKEQLAGLFFPPRLRLLCKIRPTAMA